jgi:hypothetical protein
MQSDSSDITPARRYVEFLYRRYPGRVPVVVGGTHGFGMVYPFVFEDSNGRAIGCVGCAWNKGEAPDLVQKYHINAFWPGSGDGRKMMQDLCHHADSHRVRLTLMPQPRWVDDDYPLEDDALREWYRQFGFEGHAYLTRPLAQNSHY